MPDTVQLRRPTHHYMERVRHIGYVSYMAGSLTEVPGFYQLHLLWTAASVLTPASTESLFLRSNGHVFYLGHTLFVSH